MRRFKTIGVLGGMGHVATAHFYQVLLSSVQKKYSSVQDNEYPHIIINSVPFEGSSEYGSKDESILLNEFIEGAKLLEKAGAEMIVIPCNTLHGQVAALELAISIPVIHMVDQVVGKIKEDNLKHVGLLASKTVFDEGIYKDALAKYDITHEGIDDSILEKTADLIRDVMGGNTSGQSKEVVLTILKDMKNNGVEAVILGCTELPVAISQKDTDIKLYSSTHILAEATLDGATIRE